MYGLILMVVILAYFQILVDVINYCSRDKRCHIFQIPTPLLLLA